MNEEIIDLIASVLLYANVKNQKPNPFVKSFSGAPAEDEAFNIMLLCLSRCEEYFPLIEELNRQRMEEIEELESEFPA